MNYHWIGLMNDYETSEIVRLCDNQEESFSFHNDSS